MYVRCVQRMCNVRMPQAVCDVISGIGVGAAVADSIGYQAPARYQSNPSLKSRFKTSSSKKTKWPSSVQYSEEINERKYLANKP